MNSKQIWNNQGFSIVQGMILAAVLAGTALVGTKLIQDQKLSQKNAETRDEVELLHERILSVLQERDNCRLTLEPFKNATSSSEVTTILSKVNAASTGTPVFRKTVDSNTTYMNGNVAIKSMSIAALSHPTTLITKANFSIRYERLNKDQSRRTKEGYGAKDFLKEFPIYIQRTIDSPFAFESCFAINSLNAEQFTEKFCKELEAKKVMRWDPNTNRCVFDMECPPGKVLAGVLSTGEKWCRDTLTQLNMNQFLEPTSNCDMSRLPSVKFVKVGSKVRIDCTPTTPPPGPGPGPGPGPCTPVNGTWTTGAWGTCTAGTQTRSVTCTGASCGGTCTAAVPPNSQTCAVVNCSDNNFLNNTYGANTCTEFKAYTSGWYDFDENCQCRDYVDDVYAMCDYGSHSGTANGRECTNK